MSASINPETNTNEKKNSWSICMCVWEGLGLHILLESKEEGRLGTGGERGEILPSKNQPEKRMLCDPTASTYTNFQLYCHIPLLFFT